ncbi:MAG: hypothetical protein HKN68_04375 [Saprospiraceae bacterium]|nr:hypothetical protein [Saprospiraceae bacterium]
MYSIQKINLFSILIPIVFSILIVIPLSAQNVGINVNNPQEKLHLSTDESKIALRLDNRKSVESGLNYGTVIGTPAALQNFEVNPTWIDWTDLDHTKLVNSDDISLNSPALNIVPERSNSLRVLFNFSPTIPSTAMITDVKLHIEWRRTGTFAGTMGTSFTLLKASNFQPLVNLGGSFISSSTDINITKSFKEVYNPITADMLNLDDIILNCFSLYSYTNGTSGLLIDQLWLEVEYAVPADGTEDVAWTTGAKDGTFMITQSEDLFSNQFLTIDETGTTRLKVLKITQSAGPGKVLTSNDEGEASWEELPLFGETWFNKNDTAFLASGPAQINNAIGDAALIFDKGESRLNNGINMIETDNRILNTIIDANNDQSNEQWNLYKNDDEMLSQLPAVRFQLDGGLSWINGGGNLGIGRIDPQHPLHIGTDGTNGNGAHVTTGGSWTNGSSRLFKKNVKGVNTKEILEKLATLNILEWEYKNSDEGKHLGPIAEEFYEVFRLGRDEQYISTVDADGVALAAIKALHQDGIKKQTEIEILRLQLTQLQRQVEQLKDLFTESKILKK